MTESRDSSRAPKPKTPRSAEALPIESGDRVPPTPDPIPDAGTPIDGASGRYAWRPPRTDAIVYSQPEPAETAPSPEGKTDARLQLRPVQSDRRRPARRGGGAGDAGGVVRGGSERGLARPGRADHGVRGGVSDGDLRRGRREDRDGGPGVGLHPRKGGGGDLTVPAPVPERAPSPLSA